MFTSTGRLPDIRKIVASHNTGQTHYDLGLFDQCIGIEYGQYCSAFFNINPLPNNNDSSIRVENVKRPTSTYDPLRNNDGVVGFCIPSTCSAEDLRSAIAQLVLKAQPKVPISITISSDEYHCHNVVPKSGGLDTWIFL